MRLLKWNNKWNHSEMSDLLNKLFILQNVKLFKEATAATGPG